ncbi:MAG: sialate O-acetylesterase [bacterium]
MAAVPRPVPIIVLAGQSNANSVGIGEAVFAQVTAENGLYVHAAVNGTPVSPRLDTGNGDWSASGTPGSGELFRGLLAQIAAMTDPKSPSYVPGAYLEKVIWVQGEADTWWTGSAANYQKEIQTFHQAMTARFGTHDLVISALSDAAITGTNTTDNHRANWATVQRAQQALAATDPSIHVIDPDTVAARAHFTPAQMLMSDHLHYNTATGFAWALGRTLATAGAHNAPALPADQSPASALHYSTGTEHDDILYLSATGLGQAFGSSGIDTVILTERSDGVRVGGAGLDAVRVTAATGTPMQLDLISVECLTLTAAADRVVMAAGLRRVDALGGNDWVNGRSGADMIVLGAGADLGHGGSGNDSLYGGDGHDLIFGSYGDDLLNGGAQADRLYGGAGADRLTGGTGNDTLSGGDGADVFVFAPSSGTDHITDFQAGLDLIDLQGGYAADVRISQSGTDTVLQWDNITVILDHMNHNLLTTADLLFA